MRPFLTLLLMCVAVLATAGSKKTEAGDRFGFNRGSRFVHVERGFNTGFRSGFRNLGHINRGFVDRNRFRNFGGGCGVNRGFSGSINRGFRSNRSRFFFRF